jgi:Tfp pilus assembly protein PilN
MVCGVVDVAMPHLPAEELKKALRIELARLVPLNAEKLAWGHRRIPGTKNLLRVVYWRDAEWQQALDELGGLPAGLDLLLPPAATLDPLLTGQPVLLPNPPDGDALLLLPNAEGGRDTAVAPPGTEGMFGAPPKPLEAPGILLEQPVAVLTPSRQQEFAGALLLAMYAIGPQAAADRKTLFPLPRELRVPRNRFGRMAALGLGLYLAAMVSWLGIRHFVHENQRLTGLRAEAKRLQETKKKLGGDVETQKFLDGLEKEIKTNPWVTRPTAAACLVDLSEEIPSDAWVRMLSWTDGRITLELTTANKDLDPVRTLASARNLSGVTQDSRRMEPGGAFVIRLGMAAAHNENPAPKETAAPAAAAPAAESGGDDSSGEAAPDAKESKPAASRPTAGAMAKKVSR